MALSAWTVAGNLPWRAGYRILAGRRFPVAYLCGGPHLPARGESGLLLDPGRATGHPEIDGAAYSRRRVFHR